MNCTMLYSSVLNDYWINDHNLLVVALCRGPYNKAYDVWCRTYYNHATMAGMAPAQIISYMLTKLLKFVTEPYPYITIDALLLLLYALYALWEAHRAYVTFAW